MDKYEKEQRQYAQDLAKRMGIKIDMSKVKDNEVLGLVIALKNKYKGI